MKTEIYWVPQWFFEEEAKCMKHMLQIIDYVNTHFAKSVQILPPHVPVEGERVLMLFQRLQATMPEAVAQAIKEVRGSDAMFPGQPREGEPLPPPRGRGPRMSPLCPRDIPACSGEVAQAFAE